MGHHGGRQRSVDPCGGSGAMLPQVRWQQAGHGVRDGGPGGVKSRLRGFKAWETWVVRVLVLIWRKEEI